MRAPYELRYRWRQARRLRKAKRRVERALWTPDRGYGSGRRFDLSDITYAKASEVLASIETLARSLEGRCT